MGPAPLLTQPIKPNRRRGTEHAECLSELSRTESSRSFNQMIPLPFCYKPRPEGSVPLRLHFDVSLGNSTSGGQWRQTAQAQLALLCVIPRRITDQSLDRFRLVVLITTRIITYFAQPNMDCRATPSVSTCFYVILCSRLMHVLYYAPFACQMAMYAT